MATPKRSLLPILIIGFALVNCVTSTVPPSPSTIPTSSGQTPTPATAVPSAMPTDEPKSEQQNVQLTYLSGANNSPYKRAVYAYPVGCWEAAEPCLGQVELLFEGSLDIGSISWSPDGHRLALSALADGQQSDIFVVNADGSGLTNITKTPVAESFPAWSPSGQRIAFDVCDDSGCSLASVDPSGRDYQILLDSSTPALDLTSPRRVAWFPDERNITFLAYDGSIAYEQVFVAQLDETHAIQLTRDNTFHSSPVVSPDGSQVAYIRQASPDSGQSDIFLVRPDGTAVTNLTQGAVDAQLGISWAPFSGWLSFSGINRTSVASRYDVFVLRPDGTGLLNVTNSTHMSDVSPAWRVFTPHQ
jgi:hypothetical protein